MKEEIASLLSKGRRIFPVMFMSKKPMIKGVKEYAFQAPDKVMSMLEKYIDNGVKFNLGMLAGKHSGVLTIDIDFKHPEAEKFWLDYIDLLQAGAVVSTGNGKHCHFCHPPIDILSSIGGICKGVDLICDSLFDGTRYLLIPNSIHPNGKAYKYDEGDLFSSGLRLGDELPYLPPALDQLINDTSRWTGKTASSPAEIRVSDPSTYYADNPHALFAVDPFDEEIIEEGNRNNDIAKIAGKLLYMNEDNDNYICEDLISDMKDVNERRCKPMLDEAEITMICNSIWKTRQKREAYLSKMAKSIEDIKVDFGIEDEHATVAAVTPTGFPVKGEGVIPPPDDKPAPKDDINACALYVLHQEPFSPTGDSGCHRLVYVEGDFYHRSDNVWSIITEQNVSSIVQSYYVKAAKAQVTNMIAYMKNYLYLPLKNIPFWRSIIAPIGYPSDPRKLIPFTNGLLNIENYIRTGELAGSLLPHTDYLFNTVKLPYDMNPDATCPKWMEFLKSIWGSVTSNRSECLREWVGHMMLPDVTQQKIAVFHGLSRSGKSTIGKIMHKLIGKNNSVATSLHMLTSDHGLSSLVGKTMAILYDAHLPSKANSDKAIEILKSISGGDPQIINRKFYDPYTTLLTTRLVMICNEMPKLNDSGNALINRILPFRFDISFFGQENTELESQLSLELGGIAIWAIEGIRRYIVRGRLAFPKEGVEDIQELKRLLNPISAFVDDCTVYPTANPADEISLSDLYKNYVAWSDDNCIQFKFSKDRLVSKIKAICPQINQVKRNGVTYWRGIRMREGVKQELDF